MADVTEFWNGLTIEAKKEVVKIVFDIKKYPESEDFHQLSFEQFFPEYKEKLQKYYEQVIAPQKGKQQTRYDGIIEEELPKEYTCPRCNATMTQIHDKRGIHWKCKVCDWDSERPYDFSKEAKEFHVNRCAQLLKDMFPEFNVVRNFPYSPDAILTGLFGRGTINYDLGVYYFGQKLQRLRVERNQHLTQKQFMETDHDIFVIGRKELVEKLAERDGIVVHYLIDEPESRNQIGMSWLRKIRMSCPQKIDRFGNIQYTIPKEFRRFIVTFDKKEMRRMLTADYYESCKRNMVIK